MGIDFGSKKIGIALSDDGGKMAFPHDVVPNDNKFLKYVINLIQERGIKEIVIGHSISNDGESNPIHAAVVNFITEITLAVGIPVHLEPEQYTTQQAKHIQGKTEKTDASAAAIILDGFIVKHRT